MGLDSYLRILVVDDYSTMRRFVIDSLKDLGFQFVDEASDGAKALEKLRATPFDLVITDWNMPNLSGLDMVKTMRAEPALKKIPVLMITAEAMKESIIEAARAGVTHYVIKPFTPDVLKKKMEKMFR